MARGSKIIGLQKLDRKLKRMPTAAKEHIRKAMAEAADDLVAFMKRRAPVSADGSHGEPPGTLRDSINWTWGKAPSGSFVLRTLKGAGVGGDLTLTIYATAWYARWNEFGTVKMAANPFFYVSYRAARKRTRRKISKAVRDSVKKVAKGG